MKNPRRCLLKEQNERLMMKIDKINTVADCIEILNEMNGVSIDIQNN